MIWFDNPRAEVERRPEVPGDGIYLFDFHGVGRKTRLLLPPEGEWTLKEVEPREGFARPTLILPDGVGEALLDGLVAHYHGSTDARTLRKDYDAERQRVDHLLATVSRIAEGPR